jgi:ABC-type transport system substrate-binding protein
MYTNVKADALLSKARAETSSKDRAALYRDFENIVIEDRPAIFLFAPHFIYLVPEKLRGVRLGILAHPADRLLEAYRWHIDTERVWNIFVP